MRFVHNLVHAPKYVHSSTIISIAAGLFGLDTGTIGPLTLMPQFTRSFGHLSSTVHGLVVSTILITAATTSFFTGHVANSIGRTRTIAIGTAIFGIGAALEGGSVKLGMFIMGRAVKGVGEGLFLSTVAVYITEISPSRARGRLVSIPQLMISTAICAGYFICYGTVEVTSSMSWRLPCVIQSVIAFTTCLCAVFLLPESPRWLTSQGRTSESQLIWEKLGVEAAEREKIEEGGALPKPVELKDILSVFEKKAWRQTSLGVFLMAMQQLTGIDGVLYYAPLLFASAGLKSSTASFLASGVSALLMLLVTIPALIFADNKHWGRRLASITGGVVQCFCMLTIGSLYAAGAVHANRGAARWIVIVLIYVFAIIFSATWAISFRVYVSEIQSSRTRAGATSLALSANWVVNWIVAFTTPIFLSRSPFGVYFLFGGAALLTVAVCTFWMPETSGKTLEEIDASFHKREVLTEEMELNPISADSTGQVTAMTSAAVTSVAVLSK